MTKTESDVVFNITENKIMHGLRHIVFRSCDLIYMYELFNIIYHLTSPNGAAPHSPSQMPRLAQWGLAHSDMVGAV